MAYKNKVINNVQTGQQITFLQTARDTNGKLLEMQSRYAPNSQQPVLHYHPAQEEDFIVLEGELTIHMYGETRILKAGDMLYVPKNVPHAMWNQSDKPTTVNWQVRPAMNTEHLLETINGLAADGKTNKKGMPGFLQLVLTTYKFKEVFVPAKLSKGVLKAMFIVLGPVAYAVGLRGMYEQYLD